MTSITEMVENSIKPYINKVIGFHTKLRAGKWKPLLELSLLALPVIQTEYKFIMALSGGEQRSFKFQIRKYSNNLPTKDAVVLNENDLYYFKNSDPELILTHQNSHFVFEKKSNTQFYLPEAAMVYFIQNIQDITTIIENLQLDDPRIADMILSKVITDIFREADEHYNNKKYKPAVIIGEFFNISQVKFENIMQEDYKNIEHYNGSHLASAINFIIYHNFFKKS